MKRTDVGDMPPYKTQKHTLFGLQEEHCNGRNSKKDNRSQTELNAALRAEGIIS